MLPNNDIPQELIDQANRQLFAEEYKALCEKYGMEIRGTMYFKQQIDGTFTIGAGITLINPETQK